MKPLSGKAALITGGSRGIGRAIAIQLAEAGCAVAINYLHSRQDADLVVQKILSQGGSAMAVQGDISSAAAISGIVSSVEHALGAIDILVNNAGILKRFPLEDLNSHHWDETISVNLTSSFLMSQAVLPGMRQRRWGRLIFLSSIAAQTGGVVGPHYAASKAGMLGLMHSYASLLAKEGITANAIAPALIDTEMVRKNSLAKPEMIPVGRFGHVEEVALAALTLATSPYITGQTININGGAYMS
ncbi:MAG TPA: 3-oxoacyl-ACP reductase family protein [Edaphobacter sp.]